jgi:DUF4097 and DUF4098 domain-containing protein YvlB
MSEYEKRCPVEGLRRIEIKVPRGDIVLERISGDAITVESDNALTVEQSDGTLQVSAGDQFHHRRPQRMRPPRFASGIEHGDLGTSIGEIVSNAVESIFKAEFHLSGFGAADVRVGVPAVLERPEVVAVTGAGDVALRGVTGVFTLQTSSGDIKVYEASGTIQATTGMGDVEVRQFNGPVSAHTGSGDVILEDCRNGGAVHTGSGDIQVTGISEGWNLHTGAGNIKAHVADEASLEVITGAGDARIRDGSLNRLTVRSGSGDIECTSLLTGPRHQLSTGHGDITLAVAERPGARLQVITRHGEVKSEYPLVMVGKQGPYSAEGARYVGNVGDSAIDVELRTSSGDISIKRRVPAPTGDLERASAWQAGQDGEPRGMHDDVWTGDRPASRVVSEQSGETREPNIPTLHSNPADATDLGSGSEASSGSITAPAGDPRLAVLESLRSGRITVAEAATLLEALSRNAQA